MLPGWLATVLLPSRSPERAQVRASSVESVHRPALPFIVIGGAAIVAGGLVSAASALTPSYTASWAVAYLVLVVGVAQLILGLGQSSLATKRLAGGLIVGEAAAFNLGNVGVLAGTVFGQPVVVYVGAALIVAAQALFLWAVRGGWSVHRPGHTALRWGYRTLIVVLLVSIPVGLVIASLRTT